MAITKYGHRMSSLPLARLCPQSAVLGEQYGSGRSAAMSTAHHAVCASPNSDDTKAKLLALTPEEREEISQWHVPSVLECNGVRLEWSDAHKELEVRLQLGGVTLVGHLDACWVVGDTVYVVDIKRSRWTVLDGPASLQLSAYCLSAAEMFDCTTAVPGIFSSEDGSCVWGEPIDMLSTELWSEVEYAGTNTGPAATGAHCAECYGRLHCPEFLVPAAVAVANPSMQILVDGDASSAAEALVTLKALDTLAEALRGALKAVAKDTPIVSGNRQWGPVTMPGRESVSMARLRSLLPADDAEKVVTRGKSYEVYKWHAASEK